MSLTVTARGTFTNNTANTSFNVAVASNCTAGARIVICIAADNGSSGGATNDINTVTDSLGNTWTKHQGPVFDNGAASAGVQGAIFSTLQNAGTIVTGTTITIATGASATAKTGCFWEITAAAGNQADFRTGADKSAGATGTAATLGASPTVNIGEACVAAIFMESGTTQTYTGDSDTTNGSWNTAQYAEIGSTTSGSCCGSQVKIQTTANSTQTYDATLGISSDYHGSYAIFQEVQKHADGTFNKTLGALTTSAAGKVDVVGTASVTFGALTCSVPDPTLGVHGITVQIFGTGSNPARVTLNTTSGRSWVVSRGGKSSDISTAPTDNKGNSYTAIGTVTDMTDWPGYGSAAWVKLGGIGGSSHNFDSFVTAFDEHTVTVVEVAGVNQVEHQTFTQRANSGSGSTFAATPVTVVGPALILAEWWGTGPVGNGDHVVTANNGFTELDHYGIDNPNGYVQHYIFYKIVSTGGTYGVTFTASPNQGAQLRMIALSNTAQGSTGTVSGSAGANGDFNQSLGALTISAAGKVDVVGAFNKTLGSLTTSAAGKADIVGAFSQSLGALTTSATGKVDVVGTLNKTLGSLTTSAAGKVDIVGAFSQSLGALTINSAGKVDVVGVFNKTFGALTVIADGTGLVTTTGQANITLGALTSSAAGKVDVVGTASIAFGVLSGSGGALVDIQGSLSRSFGALMLSATGEIVGDASNAIIGQANISFKPLTAKITGYTNWREYWLSMNQHLAVVIRQDGTVTKLGG